MLYSFFWVTGGASNTYAAYEDGTEMLAYKIQMLGNHPKERIQEQQTLQNKESA